MNQNNIKRRGKRDKNLGLLHKKVIRCNLLQRPVWEHEVCKNFLSEVEEEKSCKNCKYSF